MKEREEGDTLLISTGLLGSEGDLPKCTRSERSEVPDELKGQDVGT